MLSNCLERELIKQAAIEEFNKLDQGIESSMKKLPLKSHNFGEFLKERFVLA